MVNHKWTADRCGNLPATPGTPWKCGQEATMFYIGEEASADNASITNTVTAWDEHVLEHLGGVDCPYLRRGNLPSGFQPKDQLFYGALPLPDHAQHALKSAFPWVKKAGQYLPELAARYPTGRFTDDQAPFKNLWFQVHRGDKMAYGQIVDVGPSGIDGPGNADYILVFGSSHRPKPKNNFGLKASIDLSPALDRYLGNNGDARVDFRLVPASTVPAGPWKTIVTTRSPTWGGSPPSLALRKKFSRQAKECQKLAK